MLEQRNFKKFYELAKSIANKILSTKKIEINTRNIDLYCENKSYIEIATLSQEIKAILKSNDDGLRLSLSNFVKNTIKHPEITCELYMQLNDFIANCDKIFTDKEVLKIFKKYNEILYEIVIKTTKNKQENYLLSFHISNSRRMK